MSAYLGVRLYMRPDSYVSVTCSFASLDFTCKNTLHYIKESSRIKSQVDISHITLNSLLNVGPALWDYTGHLL